MLSIVIPTFNEERAIEETLKGIKKLRAVPYELIVADSGSTDHTVAIAEKYADRVVRYDDQPKNAARGRNLGVSVAQGDLLAFIDADVTIPDIDAFFSFANSVFVQDPKIVAIGARVHTLSHLETWGDRISHSIINFITYTTNNIFHFGAVSGEFQMIRASTFRSLKGYNEALNITEDNDLYTRLARVGKVRHLRKLLVLHPSRRAHAIGWPRLWWHWSVNWVYVIFLGRPWHPEWLHIR